MGSHEDAEWGAQEDSQSCTEDITHIKRSPVMEKDSTKVDNAEATAVIVNSEEVQKLDNAYEKAPGDLAASTHQHNSQRSNRAQNKKRDDVANARSLNDLRETDQQRDTAAIDPPSPSQRGRSSLDDIQQWSKAWRAKSSTGADQVALPLSTSTSSVSVPASNGNYGTSLEQLELRPEAMPLPERSSKKHRGMSKGASNNRVMWGVWTRKKKKKDTVLPQSVTFMAAEVAEYRDKILILANRLKFENVAATATRHHWSPRIVYYDRLESASDLPPPRYEPWESRSSAPTFEEFYETLRDVPDDCTQRTVLVEDMAPGLVDLLGATFQIPPHVFEEHLDRSGYKKSTDNDTRSAWHTRSSTQGYSSVNWFRPVLPLVPVTSRLRSKLIKNRKPRVRCPFEGCEDDDHNLRLNTQANIWRRQLDLCPEPGVYHKNSGTEYPVGWEERATIWTHDYDGCKFGTTVSVWICNHH